MPTRELHNLDCADCADATLRYATLKVKESKSIRRLWCRCRMYRRCTLCAATKSVCSLLHKGGIAQMALPIFEARPRRVAAPLPCTALAASITTRLKARCSRVGLVIAPQTERLLSDKRHRERRSAASRVLRCHVFPEHAAQQQSHADNKNRRRRRLHRCLLPFCLMIS